MVLGDEVIGSSFVEKHLSSGALFVFIFLFLFLMSHLTSYKCLSERFGIFGYEEIDVVIDIDVSTHPGSLDHSWFVVQSLEELAIDSLLQFMSLQLKSLKFDGIAISFPRKFGSAVRH